MGTDEKVRVSRDRTGRRGGGGGVPYDEMRIVQLLNNNLYLKRVVPIRG